MSRLEIEVSRKTGQNNRDRDRARDKKTGTLSRPVFCPESPKCVPFHCRVFNPKEKTHVSTH